MKSIKQINAKVKTLTTKLQAEKAVYENFGDKEERDIDDFIGDRYEYSYADRLEINGIVIKFANWCSDYTIKT